MKLRLLLAIAGCFPDPHRSGSIYGFVDAPKDAQHDDDWNAMDIVSRNAKITVSLNGRVVAEHRGDPQRSKVGPIGLQMPISSRSFNSGISGFARSGGRVCYSLPSPR